MKKTILILPIIFLLSGCWDYTEPNMQNYVLGMSIDYENDKYIVGIETVKVTGEPTSLSASDGIVIKSEGITLFDAVRDAIMSAGKKLYWGHAKLVIISEEVAANNLSEICDTLSRTQDIYSNISLCVAKGNSAFDVLTAKVPNESLVSEHISNIFENENPSRRFINTQLWQLMSNFPYTMLPCVYIDNFPVVDGSAVISQNKLVGFLDGEETQVYSLITKPGNGGYIPEISVDNTSVTLEILRSKLMYIKKTPRLDITVSLSGISVERTKDLNQKISQACEEVILNKIHAIASKPFGNALPSAEFDVKVTLNGTGLLR